MLLKLIKTAYLFVHPVTERHYHVGETVPRLFMLWIRNMVDILRLVTLLTRHIPLNPALTLPFMALVGLILGIDLVKSLRAFTRSIIKFAALNPTV